MRLIPKCLSGSAIVCVCFWEEGERITISKAYFVQARNITEKQKSDLVRTEHNFPKPSLKFTPGFVTQSNADLATLIFQPLKFGYKRLAVSQYGWQHFPCFFILFIYLCVYFTFFCTFQQKKHLDSQTYFPPGLLCKKLSYSATVSLEKIGFTPHGGVQ